MMYSLHEMDIREHCIEIGRKQGLEQGLERGQILAYYEMNLPVEEISRKMNLSEDKIWAVINSEINENNN